MRHSQETIDEICKLRKAKLSCEKIAKLTGLTKNTVLALCYKYVLKINRHSRYTKRIDMAGKPVPIPGRPPSVAFVKGLTDTRYYIVQTAEKDNNHEHAL